MGFWNEVARTAGRRRPCVKPDDWTSSSLGGTMAADVGCFEQSLHILVTAQVGDGVLLSQNNSGCVSLKVSSLGGRHGCGSQKFPCQLRLLSWICRFRPRQAAPRPSAAIGHLCCFSRTTQRGWIRASLGSAACEKIAAEPVSTHTTWSPGAHSVSV